jgi:lipoprotein NlpI
LAKTELNKALNLNPQHLEVFMQQSKIALEEADFTALDTLTQRIAELDAYESEALANKIVALKQTKALPSNK